VDETRARDLDETRRLLYMALVFSRTEKYELAGTLINALKHHQGVDPDPDAGAGHASAELVNRVVAYVNGHGDQDGWLLKQIEAATEYLDR
jgi:hypothetical protein